MSEDGNSRCLGREVMVMGEEVAEDGGDAVQVKCSQGKALLADRAAGGFTWGGEGRLGLGARLD